MTPHLTVIVPARGLTDPKLTASLMQTALLEGTRALALLADAEVTKRTPVDRGQLRGAWQPTAYRRHESYYARVLNPTAYAIPVNDGQVPHWPPLAPLKAWAQRVLGNAALGYVVARKIATHGTTGVHMVEQAIEAIRPRAGQLVDAALAKIRGRM